MSRLVLRIVACVSIALGSSIVLLGLVGGTIFLYADGVLVPLLLLALLPVYALGAIAGPCRRRPRIPAEAASTSGRSGR